MDGMGLHVSSFLGEYYLIFQLNCQARGLVDSSSPTIFSSFLGGSRFLCIWSCLVITQKWTYAAAITLWFWGCWVSLAPHVVGKYIISDSLALPISLIRINPISTHPVSENKREGSICFVPWFCHQLSILFLLDVPVPKSTGSMPTQMPPHMQNGQGAHTNNHKHTFSFVNKCPCRCPCGVLYWIAIFLVNLSIQLSPYATLPTHAYADCNISGQQPT